MNKLKKILILAFMFFSLNCYAENNVYFYQLFSHGSYKQSLSKIFRSENKPSWITAYLATGNGVETPVRYVTLSDGRYILGDVCKPHDCGGNTLHILFSSSGNNAWAALYQEGQPAKLYGNPDPEKYQVLWNALKNDESAY